MTRNIAVLGSTGSIGRNALRVIDALGPEYAVFALSAHSSVQLVAEQTKRYKPKFVAITNSDYAAALGELIGDLDVEILSGPDSLAEIAELDEVDIVLSAVVGSAGLRSALATVQACQAKRQHDSAGG